MKNSRKELYEQWKLSKNRDNSTLKSHNIQENSAKNGKLLNKSVTTKRTISRPSTTDRDITIDVDSTDYVRFELYQTKKQVFELLQNLEEVTNNHLEKIQEKENNSDVHPKSEPKPQEKEVESEKKQYHQIRESIVPLDVRNLIVQKDTTILVKRIAELESLVKKLSIERDMWKYKAEKSIDPDVSLNSSIIMAEEEDLNTSSIRDHARLEKMTY